MDDTSLPLEAAAVTGASAVSWAAILAGAAAALATSLTLFALAAGLDLASPGALPRTMADSAAVPAALALIVTQWIAAALGGYLTGRLRTRWVGTHTHEVFFRDSAHGFITWCVATVFLASGLLAATSSVVGLHRHADGATADARPALTSEALSPVPAAYGELVLPEGPGSAAAVQTRRAVLAQLTPEEWRMHELRPAAAEPGDDAREGERRAAAKGSILTALSMMIGAFIASVAGVLGGRHRDLHP